jgi:flagellin
MLNSINTNIAAYSAQANIGKAGSASGASIARLSSGEKITRAADDVASLSVGTALRTQVTSLRQALNNTGQGSSLLQVADGALSQITDILQRQKSIAVQAGSGSLTNAERGFLNQEFQALTSEIDRIVDSTNFNGVQLIGGGLGAADTLVNLDARVASIDFNAATNTGAVAIAGTTSIQAFNNTTGAAAIGGANAGTVDLVNLDAALTTLADADYLSVNSAVVGQFESFKFSDVTYGAANVGNATLTATINGVEFTGSVVDGATTAVVSNGNTNIQLGFTAVDFADASATSLSEATLVEDFRTTEIFRTSTIDGVDFLGTDLEGAVGTAPLGGNAAIRIATAGAIDISNFQYVAGAAANANVLTVDINGETFTATGVTDTVVAGSIISFENGTGEALQVAFAGLNTAITNIRTSDTDRANFINSLNEGFSRAGAGLGFAVGTQASDEIVVSIDDASTNALYNRQALDVATAASAVVASDALDIALDTVTAIRADVGALQSRFDFAAANVESSIQNQDAARGALLDTDVAAESTAFASSQVQLQAGISVLAQANLLPQNLLKLIG